MVRNEPSRNLSSTHTSSNHYQIPRGTWESPGASTTDEDTQTQLPSRNSRVTRIQIDNIQLDRPHLRCTRPVHVNTPLWAQLPDLRLKGSTVNERNVQRTIHPLSREFLGSTCID